MNAATIKKPQPHYAHVIADMTEASLAKSSAASTETGDNAAIANAMICILDDDGRELAVTSDMIHTKLTQLRAAC